jgi:serine/threonine protein kinase
VTPPSTADHDPEFRARLEAALGSDFRVGELLGEGGFAHVYAATDVRLGRNVAIKVIRPDLAGARAFVERFRKEATALAKFRHPGIVPIYDIREHDGLIYYIMPRIDGDTVRAQLERRGKLSPKETQRILLELCQCVAATHRAGIIHRDIKPDNVMLEGPFATPLLMDFGIAKAMDDDTSVTSSGAMIGTPTYMSPEQVTGATLVDVRSDIYSIGVLGYHMLTGHPPFTGKTAHQLIAAHVTERPQSIRAVNPSVPLGLAHAVERCLEKDPEQRYQTVGELMDVLDKLDFGIGELAPLATPNNYAMPFFAGLALACDVLAALGGNALGALTAREWWIFTAAFAGLSVLCSPFGRASTQPLSDAIQARLSAFGRRRLASRSD